MRKRASLPPIPPLSLKVLHLVEQIEEYAEHALDSCSNRVGNLVNPEKVRRILRTCIVEALDVQLEYYASLPNYRNVWIPELVRNTVDSAIGLMPMFTTAQPFRDELLHTAAYHLAQKLKKPEAATKSERIDRKKLRDEYLARFSGDVKILDICWAAGQHYCDWKRWLRNALPDGSAPDRTFRAILTSGKLPREYRKQPRPKGWK